MSFEGTLQEAGARQGAGEGAADRGSVGQVHGGDV